MRGCIGMVPVLFNLKKSRKTTLREKRLLKKFFSLFELGFPEI